MKRVKQISLIVLTMLLLAACGSLPTDGLTASMGTNQTETAEEDAAIDIVEVAVTECAGEWNPENNMLRVSFQLEADEDSYWWHRGGEALRLFGGGTTLMDRWAYVQAESGDNILLSCEGPATMTAVPLGFDKVMKPVWLAALSVPQLTAESPSGATKTLENVPIRGLLAPSAADIPNMIGAAYDLNPNDVAYQSFFAVQKALYEHYPDSAFVQEVAQNNGLSAENAARWGELYVEQDVESQQALLIDMLTSPEDEEYATAVVEAAVKSLVAMGLDFQTLSNVFEGETAGRVAIQFAGDDPPRAADLDVQITDRDGATGVVFTAFMQEASSSDESATGNIIDAETGEIVWVVLQGAAEGAAFVAAANARFSPGAAVGALIGAVGEYGVIDR